MKAYVRDDLIEFNKEYPASSIPLSFEEWENLDFEVIETDEDFETEEGFNMIIKHPKTNELISVCSIDFNFKHYEA